MKLASKNQHGFTLIELMIATTIFSIILLVAAATLIQLGKLYYKGIITSKTQNIARTVMDDVSRTVQFSSGTRTLIQSGSAPQVSTMCFGTTRYTFALKQQVDDSIASGTYNSTDQRMRHVLWQDHIGNEPCDNDTPNLLAVAPSTGRDGRELLENNMRLQDFSVDPQTGGVNPAFKIHVKILYYANKDVVAFDASNNPIACKGSVVGGQWCAISDLTSVVYSRVRQP